MSTVKTDYGNVIETAMEKIEGLLAEKYRISKRSIALLLLQGDSEIENLVKDSEGESYNAIKDIVSGAQSYYSHPLDYVVTLRRRSHAQKILEQAITMPSELARSLRMSR